MKSNAQVEIPCLLYWHCWHDKKWLWCQEMFLFFCVRLWPKNIFRHFHILWPFVEKARHITKTCLFKNIENFTSRNIKFSDKKSDIFHISAQNIDCGYSLEPPRRDSSSEYPQSMFLSRNKKNNAYPCKSQFYYIKVGFKGVKVT